MTALGVLGVWKGVGWSMVIFLAALQGVPDELYEAAAIDGAGAWRRFRHVTLPGIRERDGVRLGAARDRRLQRLHLGPADDRRRPGERDAGAADLHVQAGVQLPRLRLRLGTRLHPDGDRLRDLDRAAAGSSAARARREREPAAASARARARRALPRALGRRRGDDRARSCTCSARRSSRRRSRSRSAAARAEPPDGGRLRPSLELGQLLRPTSSTRRSSPSRPRRSRWCSRR